MNEINAEDLVELLKSADERIEQANANLSAERQAHMQTVIVRDEALKDLKNIIRVYDSQRGRFLESMGDQNPHLQALDDAIEGARRL